MTEPELPGHLTALLRHFTDLRDGQHGGGVTRTEKEAVFAHSVPLLDPFARQALDEVNAALLLGSGAVTGSGLVTDTHDGQVAQWSLSWPEQRQASGRSSSPPSTEADFTIRTCAAELSVTGR